MLELNFLVKRAVLGFLFNKAHWQYLRIQNFSCDRSPGMHANTVEPPRGQNIYIHLYHVQRCHEGVGAIFAIRPKTKEVDES